MHDIFQQQHRGLRHHHHLNSVIIIVVPVDRPSYAEELYYKAPALAAAATAAAHVGAVRAAISRRCTV